MTDAAQQAGNKQCREDKKLADQTATNIEDNKNTTTSDQAKNGQASYLPKKWIAVPIPPDMAHMTEEDLNQYFREKALLGETAKNTRFNKSIIMEEAQQVGNKQCWEDRKLACQTAKRVRCEL